MPSWYHCDNDTGAVISAGFCTSEADAFLCAAPEGQTNFVLPDNLVSDPYSATPDLSRLRVHLMSEVDAEVGKLRAGFITDVPGQPQTYERKEREAREWVAGDETINPGKYPFMIAEATVRGVSVGTVQGEIMAQVNALTPIASLVEAHRMAAKDGIKRGATITAVMNARAIDWDTVLLIFNEGA